MQVTATLQGQLVLDIIVSHVPVSFEGICPQLLLCSFQHTFQQIKKDMKAVALGKRGGLANALEQMINECDEYSNKVPRVDY